MRQALVFARVNSAAMRRLLDLLRMWLPDGHIVGREYVARNPHRADRRLGSFKVNLHTGRWADFATGDRGGDVVSLFAFLFSIRQLEAAQKLGRLLGVHHG